MGGTLTGSAIALIHVCSTPIFHTYRHNMECHIFPAFQIIREIQLSYPPSEIAEN